MNTKVTARHFEITSDLKDLAQQNFDDLQRFFDNIISCDLTLDVERHRKLAELQVQVYGQTLRATGESDNMNVSIESAFDKVKGQLKKYKGKLKQRNPKEISNAQSDASKPDTDDEGVDY
ncbi:MAG: ribosome-associated translation inhibitor RaiA [candidate division Zixibacteria bacterium]|nr:ribosome-associated translation inhibitor RaiA [candidate division Zixibacteria bacterium]